MKKLIKKIKIKIKRFYRRKVRLRKIGFLNRVFRNKLAIMTTFCIVAFLFLGIALFHENNFVIAYTKIFNSLGIYTKEIKSIDFTSGDYDSSGSWSITKKAEWLNTSTAQVEIDIDTVKKAVDNNYKDVILVIDVSESMNGDKLKRVKSDSIELVEHLLEDKNNRIALITFSSTSSINSLFTNNKDTLINSINNLNTSGGTNYNLAYKNINMIMNMYTKEDNRDALILFLTDGYPNEESPNQKGIYESLKDRYPYLTIHGVQYEMGTKIIDDIVDVTDRQWVASQDTLNNVLFEAAVSPIVYENFVVTDYIDKDYFNVLSASDISVTQGEITFDKTSQKIIWDLGNNAFKTGDSAKMTILLNLNSSLGDDDIYLPTNSKETVTYKLPDEKESTINNSSTPILKSMYSVIYEVNAPKGCSIENPTSESYKPYSKVTKKTDEVACSGYLFKGWDIDSDDLKDITVINDDTFIMPTHDVVIRGTWTKQSITKSMDGTVYEKTTLYKVLEKEAQSDSGLALKYTGTHQDSIADDGDQAIYYYYADTNSSAKTILDKNNVVFAGQCWQMIRTTDTGGVKLIYNGEAVNNQCLSTRSNHVGYGGEISSQTLSSSYYYGTSYNYDSTSKTFTLDGDLLESTWSDMTYSNLIGKYTCKSMSKTGTCSTLYYVKEYASSKSANVLTLNSDSAYSQFGTLPYNSNSNSLSSVGYKYGDVYTSSETKFSLSRGLFYNVALSTNCYYSKEISYDPVTGNYKLVNPIKIDSTSDYSSLIGYYTFESSSSTTTDSYIDYIVGVDGYFGYSIWLYDGMTIDDYSITLGNSYTKNNDGTYTLNDTTTLKYSDWYNNYSSYDYKYACDNDSETCSTLHNIVNFTATGYNYANSKYQYGSSVTWNGTKYTLVDPIEYDSRSLSTHHYTCLDNGTSCTNAYYIYYNDNNSFYYVTLSNGIVSSEVAIKNMLTKNTNDSDIKVGIDAWYEKYLLAYSDYLEKDTIFCNDRSINSLGGWNANGGSLNLYLLFKEYYSSSDLSCTNETDKFSVANPLATLKYPVGLITSPEMNILGNELLRKTESNYWLGSPYSFNGIYAFIMNNSYEGSLYYDVSSYDVGVRPAIVLKNNIEFSSGIGSRANPYIIDTSGE